MAKSFFIEPKTLIGAAIILLSCAGATYDLYFETPPMAEANLAASLHTKEWPAAPDFNFIDIEGMSHKLSDFKGKIVIIDFWASWCQPCLTEFPHIVDFVASLRGDAVLIALSSDPSISPVRDFIAKQSASVQAELKSPYIFVVLDEGRKITKDIFLTEMYPETIFVAPDMHMVKKTVGDIEWNGPEMARFVAALKTP